MPETVILRVLMHCEGCANAVKRACARIPGVATYTVDYPAQKVIVTGNVNRDKVLKRILKTGKHAELEEPTVQVKKEEKPKQEVIKKANSPPKEELYPTMAEVQTLAVQTVILKVVLHCEGCARTVKRAIKRIPGVTAYDVDFPGQKVTVTGAIIPEDVYRHVSRTGKITVLVPPPPPPPPSPEEPAKVEEPPKEEPPKAEEPKPEDAKPEEPKKEEPAPAPAPAPEEKKEEPPKEEGKPEEPKKEEEAKKEEAAPAAEEKKEEEKKPEEAKPEEKKEEAAAPAAEEKKDESKEEAKPEPAPEPPPPPTMEELYPVTFVLGPDYTRYYYY